MLWQCDFVVLVVNAFVKAGAVAADVVGGDDG